MNSNNYNLDKFDNTEIYDISKFNDNSDLIDKEINRIYEVSDITEPKENKIYNVFISSSNGNITNINGTNVYRENTTNLFTLKSNRVYSLYYKDNNFYVKLSSSGNAVASDVKQGKTFTNETGEEITGTSNKIYGGGTR